MSTNHSRLPRIVAALNRRSQPPPARLPLIPARGRATLLGSGALALLLAGCGVEVEGDALDPLEAGEAAATDVIVDDEGQVIGSFDAELNRLDVDGNLAKGGLNAVDDFFPMKVVLWEHGQFSGRSDAWYNSSTTLTLNLSGHRQNNVLSSLSIAAGCKATLYDGNLTTVLQTINSTQANVPSYVNSLGAAVNDKVSSIKVECKTTTNTFCGYGYKDASYLGDRLPLYKDYVIRFSEARFSGWNDQISSVSWNSTSSCDGIGLWEHSDGSTSTTQKRRHLKADDSTLHDDGLGDQVSAVETDREISSGEKTSAEVGEMMTAVANQRNWGKAFVCNAVDDICTNHKTALVTLTTVFGGAICRAILGAAVMEGVGAAVGIAVTGGTAAAIAVPVAALTSAQIAFGAACLTAAASSMVTIPAACDATMDTWCANYVNPTDP